MVSIIDEGQSPFDLKEGNRLQGNLNGSKMGITVIVSSTRTPHCVYINLKTIDPSGEYSVVPRMGGRYQMGGRGPPLLLHQAEHQDAGSHHLA